MAAGESMRVCIDARIADGVPGGVQQALIGLASGLSALTDGAEEYRFLVHRGASGWLEPHLSHRCGLLALEPPAPRGGWRAAVRTIVPRELLDRAVRAVAARRPIRVPRSDGSVEAAGVDVMHFALQHGFETRIPSIYVPHDLQHRHHPELFTRYELRWREAYYPFLARQAAQVVALTRTGKQDIVSWLGVPPGRVAVIGWAPVLDAYAHLDDRALETIRSRLGLHGDYALYPAQTFRHKNHAALLEALALLRKRGVRVPLVCPGRLGDAFPQVARSVERLGLGDQVRFLGFVAAPEMQALYRFARLMVFPSLFEGFGMPLQEAFRAGVPVVCSNAAALPEVAGDAAVLFDPRQPAAIADAVWRVWSDRELAVELVERGRRRAAGRTWTDVARAYRALYRLVGGRPLDAVDRALLRDAA